MDPDLRRRNLRVAWVLAALAVFILLASVPFWRGLFRLAVGGGQ